MANYPIDQLDVNIMYGIVNEKLRLECDSFDEVLLEYELDKAQFEQKLDDAGFYYDPLANQLRQK